MPVQLHMKVVIGKQHLYAQMQMVELRANKSASRNTNRIVHAPGTYAGCIAKLLAHFVAVRMADRE